MAINHAHFQELAELLYKVKEDNYDQQVFFRLIERKSKNQKNQKVQPKTVTLSRCNTAACIAGHASILAGAHQSFDHHDASVVVKDSRGCEREPQDIAAEWLGIGKVIRDNTGQVFYDPGVLGFDLFSGGPEGSWPRHYALRWARALALKRAGITKTIQRKDYGELWMHPKWREKLNHVAGALCQDIANEMLIKTDISDGLETL